MRLTQLIMLTVPLVLLSPRALSDELAEALARTARLEATVQELTLQLAESLKERARLESALSAALAREEQATLPAPAVTRSREEVALEEVGIAEETPGITATGTAPDDKRGTAEALAAPMGNCDVDAALQNYAGTGDDNKALSTWLKAPKRLEECSTAQLKQLRKAVDWDFWGYQKEVLALLDNELEKR